MAEDAGSEFVVPPVLRGARVVVAEDSAINQQVIRQLLERAGAEVLVADDGREAIRLVSETAVDCVLMDLEMPIVDGLEACRAIRRDPTRARLPIIAMTAHDSPDDRDRCLAAGMDDFVTKPLHPTRLLTTLHGWLSEQPASRPAGGEAETRVFDERSALSRVAGNRLLLHRLLADLLRDWRDGTEPIRRLRAAHDDEAARRATHTLRGASALLGLAEVSRAAAELEDALGTASPAAALDRLDRSLTAARETIDAWVHRG